ncbi:MAG TPA: hypothetical protein VJU81_19595 [Methylomirabilota bacterium]|nr:hypothetical protein [Methylomirabilota bacterium]
MAITGLNLPIDIPWERVCVARDMVDPGRGVADETPPLWQSSVALFRYVPPDEYQVYPGRRILYYKLTCSITNYQPRDQQVLGAIDLYGLGTGTLTDEDVKRRLEQSLPCTAAVVQVSVSASEGERAPQGQPYFLDVQPRQRLLYEQVTETQERASRSLETLQVRKDAASSNSVEVLDVDQGGGLQIGVGPVSVGGQRAGEWGTKSLGRQDSTLVTTTDGSREARETLAFTTQLSQMYTLLQAYHLGTNRVVFYVTPRPHTIEPPTGLSGPRALDGIQDFFLVVSQAREDRLPCLTVRLDTGHLAVQPVYDFDRSQPPQTLTVEALAPAPIEGDPSATGTGNVVQGGFRSFYGCFFKSVVQQGSLTAPSGYVIEGTEDLESLATGRSGVTNTSTVDLSLDQRQVNIVATATGFACHRNTAGDAANHAAVGPLDFVGVDAVPEHKHVEPGHVRRTVRVSFRSELPTRKVEDLYLLVLTTRQLRCCDTVTSLDPKITDLVPVDDVAAGLTRVDQVPSGTGRSIGLPGSTADSTAADARPTAAPTSATSPLGLPGRQPVRANVMHPGAGRPAASQWGLVAMNAMQRWLAEETQRLSMRLRDPVAAPARDREVILRAVLGTVLADPRRRSALSQGAGSLGLSRRELSRLGDALGRPSEALTRLDVLAAPDAVLEAATGRKAPAILRLRLSAAGLPIVRRGTRPPRG